MNIARRGEEEWKKMLVCMHQTSCVVNEKKHALSLSGAFLACRARMTAFRVESDAIKSLFGCVFTSATSVRAVCTTDNVGKPIG